MRFGPFWRRVQQLTADGALPEWMVDRQDRARATRQHVLAAAARLLNRRPFPTITMAEIAEEAEISIGALYARFPSKEAVLAVLGLAVLEEVRDRFVRALDAVPAAKGLRGLVGAYADTLVAELHRFRRVVTELRRHGHGVEGMDPLLATADRAIRGEFAVRARRHAAEIAHENTDAAVQWALFTTNAAAREAILADALAHYAVPRGRRALRRDLARSALTYLMVDEP